MTKSPAFQFYPADFVIDTSLLTAQQVGVYTLLICAAWKGVQGIPQCHLPNDDESLAAIGRVSLEEWRAMRKKIVPYFDDRGELLAHARLLKELAKQDEWKAKSSAGGKKSAAARASSKGGSTTLATVVQPEGQPNANSSVFSLQSSVKEETASAKPKRVKKKAAPLPDEWTPNETHQRIAAEERVNLDRELAKFRDHAKANGRKQEDWDAAFRTWLRRASEFQKQAQPVRRDFGDETARDAVRATEARARQAQREAEKREQEEEHADREARALEAWWEDLDAETRAEVEGAARERCKNMPKSSHRMITTGVMHEWKARQQNPFSRNQALGGSSA